MKNTKNLLFALCSLGGGILIGSFCKGQTDGFALWHIQTTWKFEGEEERETIPEEVVSQPYFYLGRGAQMAAFASEDGNYVIKFYRHKRVEHPLEKLAFLFPPSLKTRLMETVAKRKAKRVKDFLSYRLAFENFKEETALLFLHLHKTSYLKQKMTLYDKIGVKHQLDLDKVEFVIQKKCSPFYPTLESWVEKGEFEKVEKGVTGLVSLLKHRLDRGIFDKDPDLKTNFGFIGTTPVQYDIGRFSKDVRMGENELVQIIDPLCKWLESHHPPLAQKLRREIKQ